MQTILYLILAELYPFLAVYGLPILAVIALLFSIAVFSTRRKFTKKNITRSRLFFASHVLFLFTIPQILFWLFFSAIFVAEPGAFAQIILGIYSFLIVLAIPDLLLKLLAIIISLALYGPFIQKFYIKSPSYLETMPPTRVEYIKLVISLLFLVLPFVLWATIVDWKILLPY